MAGLVVASHENKVWGQNIPAINVVYFSLTGMSARGSGPYYYKYFYNTSVKLWQILF